MPLVVSDEPLPMVRDPIYHQLHERLMELVRRGDFPAGAQFLTERQVAEKFQVSRVTANKALSHMVVSGCLEFRKGVGTFVKPRALENDLRSLDSFTAKTEASGRAASTRVVAFRTLTGRKAPADVAAALGLAPGDPVYYCERLRLVEGEPVIFEQRHIAAHVCPGLTKGDLAGSFYDLLTKRFHVKPAASRQTIRAVAATPRQADILRIADGSPVLWVHAVGLCEVAIWVEDTYYRGDHYEFSNEITPRNSGQPAGMMWSEHIPHP